jgi:Ca2+-transporting ATPase
MMLPACAPQDNSLLTMPPWINPWLLAAEAVSFGSHFLILYVPVLANIFGIVPLNFQEWLLVIVFASPVILIDEVCARPDARVAVLCRNLGA